MVKWCVSNIFCCRLRTSAVLVVGARGLGAELCKNIVLAGVRSVTLLDDGCLTSSTLGSRFLGRTDGVNVSVRAYRGSLTTSVCFTASSASRGATTSPQS